MGYGLTYRMRFTSFEGFNIVTLIQDTTTLSPFAEEYVKDLIPSGDPLRIQIIDTDEDKYTPIKAKSVIIKILSDNTINASLFVLNSTDNRWKVDIYVENPLNPLFLGQHLDLFTGFLVLNDISEPFLDSTDHQEIKLTASDGIGLLKDIPLAKPDGTNPKGKYTIIQYISWCLLKTGLQLPINVMNNLMEESFIGLPAYNNIKIAAKTFEDQINTCINCYEVLKRILGEECYLGQWKNQWWIKRIDEIEDNKNFADSYDPQGIYTGTSHDLSFVKNIGLNQPIQLITPATNVLFERTHNHIQETFDFQFPLEIVDNIDFSRGNWISPLNLGDPYLKPFNFDDWTPTTFEGSPPTGNYYIVRRYEDLGQTYEKERYLRVVPNPSQQSHYDFARANPIPVGLKDKFSISVDFRYEEDIPQSGTFLAHIFALYILGSDGNYYFFQQTSDSTGKWTQSSFSGGFVFGYVYKWDSNLVFEKEYQTVSLDLPPVPIDGDFYLGLYNPNAIDLQPRIVNYVNLQVTYTPFINGSYAKYSAQHNKVFRNIIDLKAKRENQVYISDSPKKLFKGALFKIINGIDVLAGQWVNGAIPALRTPPVDPQYFHKLSYMQAFSVWNQYNREMRILDFNAVGLDSGTEMPDIFHYYIFSDYHPHVYGKKFLLCYYEQDLYRCQWKGHLKEVFDFQHQKIYNNLFEFKYIEQR